MRPLLNNNKLLKHTGVSKAAKEPGMIQPQHSEDQAGMEANVGHIIARHYLKTTTKTGVR